MPRLLPRFLVRWAWRDLHLLGRVVRLAADRRGRRFLWHMLHTPRGTWRRCFAAFLVNHHEAILGRALAANSPQSEGRGVWDRARWESLFAAPDPWGYSSSLRADQVRAHPGAATRGSDRARPRAGCAEGHFTVRLAPRVGTLVAADIAAKALERAADRCAGQDNVSFRQLDMRRDPLPAGFDLIVCSEVLYYIGDGADLRRFARRLGAALAPAGHLLVTHANAVVDDPGETGFDWQVGFAAKHIGETLARVPRPRARPRVPHAGLSRAAVSAPRVARTEDGAGTRGQRAHHGRHGRPACDHPLGRCAVTRLEAANAWATRALPILMFTGSRRMGRGTGPLSCGTRPLRAAAGLSAAPRLPQHHARAVAFGAEKRVTG